LIDLWESLQEAITESETSREEARTHYRYYYGDQLPVSALRILQDRGQPVRWENEYRKIAAAGKKSFDDITGAINLVRLTN
jgi:hypothetical protein